MTLLHYAGCSAETYAIGKLTITTTLFVHRILSLFYAHAWAHMHALLFHIFFINDHRIHEILNYTSQWAIGAMRWRLIWVGQRLFRRQLD
jgi:hypothetical protein